MKSTKQNKDKGLTSRTELVSTSKNQSIPKRQERNNSIDFQLRRTNRSLSADKVLELVSSSLPKVLDLAKVVRKWVWIRFGEAPAGEVRQELAQIGFHWNRKRRTWQHPCGEFGVRSHRSVGRQGGNHTN